jgi:hypothetical protein
MNIIELAKEAGFEVWEADYALQGQLERFVALVRAEYEAPLKLAEEALEKNLPFNYVQNGLGEKFPCFSNDPLRESKTREALAAIREARAEPVKQEPVACANGCDGVTGKCNLCPREELYAAPAEREWVDLTDAELNNLWICNAQNGWLGLFRAVIAAFKEKNK